MLLLLQQGVNDLQHWVFASPEDDEPGEAPVTVAMTVGGWRIDWEE